MSSPSSPCAPWYWRRRNTIAWTSSPWNATTLEWQTPSPPKHGNWVEIPVVHHGPYEYSHPEVDKDWLAQNEGSEVVSPAPHAVPAGAST